MDIRMDIDWVAGARILDIQRDIKGGAKSVEKNQKQIISNLGKIKKRKRYITEELYQRVEWLEELFSNGTSYAIIYSNLAGFVSRYHPNSRF